MRAAAVMLCLYCTQTHTKLQSKFSRKFLKTNFARLRPLASAARCGPRPRTPSLRLWEFASMNIATQAVRPQVSFALSPCNKTP